MSNGPKLSTSMLEMFSLSDITSWDDHYDNPKAEIILVSKDRIGFRVDAWHFQKESGFIRDLLTFPSNQELKPVELDHDSKIVRYFIDFVMAHSTSTNQISMAEFEQLFQLSDKFQTVKVDQTLLVAIGMRTQLLPTPADLNPRTVFKFAANRDSVALARDSIRAMEGAGIERLHIFAGCVSNFDGIPSRYIAGLWLAAISVGYLARGSTALYTRIFTWQEVADNFSVV